MNTLEESKTITQDINHKLTVAKHIEDRIEENRKIFKPVAQHGARLYFAVQDLAMLDPMYVFSMKWFRDLFLQTFKVDNDPDSEDEAASKHEGSDTSVVVKAKQLKGGYAGGEITKQQQKEIKQARVLELKQTFREILYRAVCMSLFERHKLLFAFFMALKIYEHGFQGDASFAERLKELDKLHDTSGSGKMGDSRMDSSRISAGENGSQKQGAGSSRAHGRSGGASQHRRVSQLGGAGLISASRVSDQETHLQSQAHIMAQQREEEKLKINNELLKYTLTGLLPADFQIYSDSENPRPDLFTGAMWQEMQ